MKLDEWPSGNDTQEYIDKEAPQAMWPERNPFDWLYQASDDWDHACKLS
jgi:hypothetical protein